MDKAAVLCGLARSTIQRACRDGRLPRGPDGLIDTADLVHAGFLDAAHADDPIPTTPPLTLRHLYETLVPLLQTISAQLTRLLQLLEPGASQPPARSKKRPPGAAPCPC